MPLAITGPVTYFWQVEEDAGSNIFDDIIIEDAPGTGGETIRATGPTFTVRDEEAGLRLRVRAVYQELAQAQEKDLAYNTVQTLLRLMEKKELVAHTEEGRTFVYRALYSRDDTAVRFLDRVFDGAADQLVQSLLRAERIPPAELDRMRELIDQARRQSRDH